MNDPLDAFPLLTEIEIATCIDTCKTEARAVNAANALNKYITRLQIEIERLRTRLLTAAGDDLCRLTQEEIKAMGAGEVKIPPREEFLASCDRFHAQVAGTAGVLPNCLTLAQLVAENEQWRRFASYCRSCALSGESNPQTFQEFCNYTRNKT